MSSAAQLKQSISDMMNSRISRSMLQVGQHYIMIKEVNGVTTEEDVGTFVHSYMSGSGDGMTLHWEFNNGGKVTMITDEMWGSVSGKELTHFRIKA